MIGYRFYFSDIMFNPSDILLEGGYDDRNNIYYSDDIEAGQSC